jgi:hypothetical protein
MRQQFDKMQDFQVPEMQVDLSFCCQRHDGACDALSFLPFFVFFSAQASLGEFAQLITYTTHSIKALFRWK